MKHIVLFGAGGHGRVVRDIIAQQHAFDLDATIVAVYDDFVLEKMLDGSLPILNTTEALDSFTRNNGAVVGLIGISDNEKRQDISKRFPLSYYKAIHPSAIIAEDVKIGEGTVIMAGAIINTGAQIGKHCIINSGAIVEHDCIIGDYSHISSGVRLGGNVVVGSGSHVRIGAVLAMNVEIPEKTIVPPGSILEANTDQK